MNDSAETASDATDDELRSLSETLGASLKGRGWLLTTAESCTGGWVAKVVTDTAGSSEWFDRGFVTYSNEAKQDLVGVSPQTLSRYGAVSEVTVSEMAQGALARSRAEVSVAISGIAGPAGGTPEKPVGTVWIAWGRREGEVRTERQCFEGDRKSIRRSAMVRALEGLIEIASRDE